jgi:hypothetical protein
MPINPIAHISQGDKTVVQYAPTNYTSTVEEHTDATNQISAHLHGIDDEFAERTTAGKSIALAIVFGG